MGYIGGHSGRRILYVRVQILIQRELVTVMVPQSKLCQNIVFYYLYNDNDLATVRKISPVLYNVCIAVKLP